MLLTDTFERGGNSRRTPARSVASNTLLHARPGGGAAIRLRRHTLDKGAGLVGVDADAKTLPEGHQSPQEQQYVIRRAKLTP